MKKSTFIILTLAIALFSCSKDNSSGSQNPSSVTNKISITNFQACGDSVVITWTSNHTYTQFTIVRRDHRATDTTKLNYGEEIGSVYNSSTLTFSDRTVPQKCYLEYQVIASYYDNITHANVTVCSNVRSFSRPELKSFMLNPKDVLQDLANHRLFIIGNDSGKISQLDYNTREITKQIYSYATLGYSSLGMFNGTQELYVPRNDGYVYIYNAATLDKIDQIRCGNQCFSVVCNNGKLFVAVDTSSYDYALRVYDRASKALITHTNIYAGYYGGLSHIEMVPGSNTKLFGVGGDYVYSFQYDANGHYQSISTGNFDYSSTSAFAVFPNGQGLIIANHGSVYSNSLTLIQTLPYGDYQYSAYALNSPFTSIFAGCSNYKNIIEYSYPGYSERNTYKCNGYPAAVFIDGTNLIALSNTYTSYYDDQSTYMIDRIPLVTKK